VTVLVGPELGLAEDSRSPSFYANLHRRISTILRMALVFRGAIICFVGKDSAAKEVSE
jgi:hypothetical protein